MLDPQDESFDRRLATHLVSLYYRTGARVRAESIVSIRASVFCSLSLFVVSVFCSVGILFMLFPYLNFVLNSNFCSILYSRMIFSTFPP